MLKFETEEQFKDCMVKWGEIFGYNIQLEQWQKCSQKVLNLHINLKENFTK